MGLYYNPILTQPNTIKSHQFIKSNAIRNICSCLVIGLFISSFLICCETEDNESINDPDFAIVFSGGTTISEKDLLFYDSSTHILFLKEELKIGQSESGFTVLVDNDIIYQGIIYPAVLSMPPPHPIYISDYSPYGNDIIHIDCLADSFDFRNDQRIITALEKSKLLHHGISCHINHIKVMTYNDYSEVICTITIQNHDSINYYILDPEKMGSLDFNYYTGGLLFVNNETKVHYFLRWSIQNPDWDNLTFKDLSILQCGKDVTYTFESSDYHKLERGVYKATFNFYGTRHNTPNFELNRKNGRIWVGRVHAAIDNINVD